MSIRVVVSKNAREIVTESRGLGKVMSKSI